MFEGELKRKLRSLKKLERRMRWRYLTAHEQVPLVWDSYFSTGSHRKRIKYPFAALMGLEREQRKRIFEEYLYFVFLQHAREEGISMLTFQDPEILSYLGLPCYATLSDIKTRFRQLAHEYHPDKGGDHEKMIELLEMYEKCFPKKSS
jgi:hypothetical protein